MIQILFAEDDTQTRQDIASFLRQRFKVEVLEAADGEEAYTLFERYRPPIVITDITMPKLDGLSFVDAIREVCQLTKVIVISAHDEFAMYKHAISQHIITYLLKPVTRNKLVEAVETALETMVSSTPYDRKVICLSESVGFNPSKNILQHQNGTQTTLTQTETRCLQYIVNRKDQVVQALELYEAAYDDGSEYSSDKLRTLIRRLRKKIPQNTLENIYGGQYQVNLPNVDSCRTI